MTLTEKISQNRILLSDGAWGTFLQAKGLKPGECPELWNITHRSEVLDIAMSYLNAGSDIIETNSFGGSWFKLNQYGLGDRVTEINRAAAEISRQAAGPDKHVAGSIGPTGKLVIMGDVTEDELYNAFKVQAVALAEGGADILIIETMTATDEAVQAVKASRENTSCTVIATMTFSEGNDNDFYTMMGVSVSEMVHALKAAGAHIVGSNCGNGIRDMIAITKAIKAADPSVPVMIQANAGIPELIDGVTVYRESPLMMASFVPELIKAGASIIGGCCGTTPEHIKEIRKIISQRGTE